MTTLTRSTPDSTRRPRSDDELIAYTLIALWELTTGRALRDDVPPAQLSEYELIAFWSDPVLEEVFES